MTPAIELVGIDKRFGAVHANRAVSFAVAKGTIHGIVGENGAGKSTLMSILYGYYQADAGEILLGGRQVAIPDSQSAIALGIGMVHQHFMLVDTFTVLENVVLGIEGGRLLGPALAKARSELERLARDYALEVDPDAIVGDLAVGLQQRVEILKALYRGAEILILDEPTGVLTPQEADHLFRILGSLKAEGKTIILITHKLREIMDVTDAVTVMRQGTVVGTVRTAETGMPELAELMVGRKVELTARRGIGTPGAAILEVAGLDYIDERKFQTVKSVSLTIRAGEIVGIAGVAGNGQSELIEMLAGIRTPAAGTIRLNGRDLAGTGPRERRALGIAHVPEDRNRMGLVTAFAARESAILGYHRDGAINHGPFFSPGAILARCRDFMARFDVRPQDPDLRTALFSGGNQQKIVLAREIARDPALLLIGQPTRGVDIGAIEFIHREILALRDAGKAILLVSVELDEILALSDRILVMAEGRITGEMAHDRADERSIGLMMAGEAMAGEAA